jgi:hypothetical protein
MFMFKAKMAKRNWLEPKIELAQSVGLSQREIHEALRLIQEHEDDIRNAWHKHFPG